MVKGTNRVDGNCDSRPSTSVEHVEHGIRHFSRKVLDLVDCIGLERQLITTPALFFSTFYLSFFLSSFYIYCFAPPFARLSLSLFFFVKFFYILFFSFFFFYKSRQTRFMLSNFRIHLYRFANPVVLCTLRN